VFVDLGRALGTPQFALAHTSGERVIDSDAAGNGEVDLAEADRRAPPAPDRVRPEEQSGSR